LIKHLPKYYKQSKMVQGLSGALDAEVAGFSISIQACGSEMFLESADKSLERWEKDYGIEADKGKSIEARKSLVKSRILGQGSVTVALLQKLIEDTGVGEVAVENISGGFTINVKFQGIKGIPKQIDEIKEMLEELKPAHYVVGFDYLYNTYGYLENCTYGELEAYTYEELGVMTL